MTLDDVLGKIADLPEGQKLAKFMQLTKPHPEIRDRVIEIGIRAALKQVAMREYKSATSAERTRRAKVQKAADERYADRHDIPVEEVSKHRMNAAFSGIKRTADLAEVGKKAIALMDGWRLSDGTILGDATSEKLGNEAVLFTDYATFYMRLSALVKGDTRLRDAPRLDRVIAIHTEIYAPLTAALAG